MKVAIITNISTPYRDPVYEILSNFEDIESKVFFCSKSEPNRNWNVGSIEFDHVFLSKKSNRLIHYNFNVIGELNKFNPSVVLTAGFNPTMLIAWFWVLLRFKKHIPFSDANMHSERSLSVLHKIIRKIVFSSSNAFIGASEGTLELFKSYKISSDKLFKSCLAIDNNKYKKLDEKKDYDLMFCGQFIKRKQPMFFCEIAKIVFESKKDLKILLLGSGPLKADCLKYLSDNKINYTDAGFVQPIDLPSFYKRARLFLFPTQQDPWGLVANEALAAGVPVLVSSVAGSANELVIDNFNGFTFDNLDKSRWVEKINFVFKHVNIENKMSLNAAKSIENYTFSSAAKGIYNAIKFAIKN